MSDAKLDLLTTRCCSPMNTWATVRGFLVVGLERERIEGQIAVLEEMNAAMTKQNGGPFCNEKSEWSFAKIAALRKELKNG